MLQPSAEKRIFIYGLGYTGEKAAHRFLKAGWSVSGTTRHRFRGEQDGIYVVSFDEKELIHQILGQSTHVLSTIPPNEDGSDPVLQEYSHNKDVLQWVGYLSSTSVYGNHNGEWVDETSELRADSGQGRRRRVAEGAWMSLGTEHGLAVHIFRCGGIYGPGRNVLENLVQGKHESHKSRRYAQRFTARCHVADVCSILLASACSPRPKGGIYNVVDDDPASRQTVVNYAGMLLGYSAQVFSPSEDDARCAAIRGEKRVRNDAVKSTYGIDLQFPDYKAGLDSILQDISNI